MSGYCTVYVHRYETKPNKTGTEAAYIYILYSAATVPKIPKSGSVPTMPRVEQLDTGRFMY